MTWKAYRTRGETLRSVIETADARRDGDLPWDVPGVSDTFRDELDLIGALHLKWHTRLAGHVERALSAQPMDLTEAVISAWCRTAGELGGVRLILERYAARPTDEAMAVALAKASAKEHRYLAVVAGRSSLHDPLAEPVGAAIEERARSGLLDRPRSVIAA